MSFHTIHNFGGVILAGGLLFGSAGGAFAQNAPSIPDAQVESNVLKALASTPELSTQNIQSSTVYGTVTLTGNVHDEALRTTAENLIARVQGVKKVVDELTLGDTPPPSADQSDENEPAPNEPPDSSQGNQQVLQSDGTYAPAPNSSAAAPPPAEGQAQNQDQGQQSDAGAPEPPSGREPMNEPPQNTAPIPGGQRAGIAVTIPPGAMLRIRINRGIDSDHIRPGTPFDGIVLTDVVADGEVAIPRGASVSGTVINAKKAGVFKGDGELSLQIDSLTLGGRTYPLATEVWTRSGRDKNTVGNTVGLGAIGAFLGAVAGGGTGAAVGAGIGAGAGLAGSASSPRGQIIIPPESVLTFRTDAPVTVNTVSEREMERLSYAAGPERPRRPRVRRYSPYYGYYYGPPLL